MAHDDSRNTFLESFVGRYGPKNITKAEPEIRTGFFGERQFTVIETKYNYAIEMDGKKKKFSSGWTAARWIQKNK